jgi:hypothetical protein
VGLVSPGYPPEIENLTINKKHVIFGYKYFIHTVYPIWQKRVDFMRSSQKTRKTLLIRLNL